MSLEMALSKAAFKTAKAEVFQLVGRAEGSERNPAVHYPYTDADGKLLFEVVRHVGPRGEKTFRQRRPDGEGGWTWNLNGVQRVPYRLADVLKAETVYLPEGEKDVHTLAAWGLVASCNSGGSGSSHLYAGWGDYFRGRHVVVLPDNDAPGRKHARAVAAALLASAASVRIVELPDLPPKGDVTDWKELGGTAERLRKLTDATLPLDAKTSGTPSPFRLTDDAVVYVDPEAEREPVRICGRLEIVARTSNANGEGWGILLQWTDSAGRSHRWAMPMSLLAGEGNEYRSQLLDGGLFLAPGRKARELLTVYLQTMHSEAHVLCVSRLGWHGDAFVLPDEAIGPPDGPMILFQTPVETDHYLNVSGTADDWRQHVGRFCSGNSRLILAVSCAFAGPVLSWLGGESGGLHFTGATSTGKTTALLVGGSVLGGGGRNGFVQSWRATANGLEAIAELHNDQTLFLDELAQVDASEAAETAYLLGNGSGKTRMSRSIGTRKKLSWTLLFVSTGETTLADHVQTAGKRTRGGAEVRLLNIEADAGTGLGLFEQIHHAASADAFARQLKDAARRFYGSPFRAYLQKLSGNRGEAERKLHRFQEDVLDRCVPPGAMGEVYRAAQRFSLIAAAGELATEFGLTGWDRGEASESAARCLESWIAGRGTAGDAGINQVRRFLEAHGASRFQAIRNQEEDLLENHVVQNRAGYVRKTSAGEVEFLMFPETFKNEVCVGFDYQRVARSLEARGLLERQPPDLTMRVRLPGSLGLIRAFAVKASILEA
jgi:uncharacterized protein (DUF927 family)